jgi:hypothetical protein
LLLVRSRVDKGKVHDGRSKEGDADDPVLVAGREVDVRTNPNALSRDVQIENGLTRTSLRKDERLEGFGKRCEDLGEEGEERLKVGRQGGPSGTVEEHDLPE